MTMAESRATRGESFTVAASADSAAGSVTTWHVEGGFLAWAITDAGQAALAGSQKRGGGSAT